MFYKICYIIDMKRTTAHKGLTPGNISYELSWLVKVAGQFLFSLINPIYVGKQCNQENSE